MSQAPLLGEHQVHIWQASLDLPSAALAELYLRLSPAERMQAAHLHTRTQRSRFIARRGVLRQLLGRYLQRDPAAIEFSYGATGKPMLAGAPPTLHFSLAHSAERAIYALSRCGPLGIDLEAIRPELGYAPIVQAYFTPAERAAFAQLPAEHQPARFFRLWACKEACVKASGAGIDALPAFDPHAHTPLQPAADCSVASAASAPHLYLRELAVGPAYAAALALACERCALAQLPTFEYY